MAGPQTLNPRLQFPVTFSFKKLLYPVPLPAHLMKSVHMEEGEGQLLQCADWLTVKCPDSAARSVHRQQTRARHSQQCVWWTEALKLQRGLWHRTPPVRAETHLVISLFPPTASEEGVCVYSSITEGLPLWFITLVLMEQAVMLLAVLSLQ